MKNKQYKFIDPKAAEKFLNKAPQKSSSTNLLKKLKNGNKVFLSKAITLSESGLPKDRKIINSILAKTNHTTKRTIRIGITGSPGVGKSTFIETFGEFLTKKGLKIAVLAVDPSSMVTKGSILGDKTRMEQLSKNDLAFIRPSPAGEQLGGVAKRTKESILLCELAGFDIILVETVGIGQSEVMVKDMTDVFLLLLQPGAGDELQGIKKGVVELADILVVNKMDGDKKDLAKKTKASYASALHLFLKDKNDWQAKVLACSALKNENIDAIWKSIKDYEKHQKKQNLFEQTRINQNLKYFRTCIKEDLFASILEKLTLEEDCEKLETQIAKGKLSSFKAIQKIKDLFTEKINIKNS